MKMNLLIASTILLCSCLTQLPVDKHRSADLAKVDSVFTYYFKLVDLEANESSINDSNIQYYSAININSDTVYMLRDLPKALTFLGEISGIKMQNSPKGEKMLLSKQLADLWKGWYYENKDKIVWNRRRNKPELKQKLK